MPHSRHIGTIRMIAEESAKLSYSAECVRKTNSTQSGKIKQGGVARGFFLVRQLGPFERETGGQNLLGEVRHDLDGLPAADARGAGAVDLGRGIEVVAIDAIGVDDVLADPSRCPAGPSRPRRCAF